MKTKNIILGLWVSLMAGAPAVKSMETPLVDLAATSAPSTTTTSSTTGPLKIEIEDMKKPENPYKTGFWDKTLHDPEMSVDQKIALATERAQRHMNLFKMYTDQVNDTDYDKQESTGDRGEKVLDEGLVTCIKALHTFFEHKFERTKEALYHFQSKVRAQTVNDFGIVEYPHFKNYSGKLNGKPKEQAEYALSKYLAYREMSQFIKFFPIDPPALNPILVKTIMENINEMLKERADLQKALHAGRNFSGTSDIYNKHLNPPIFTAISRDTFFVNLEQEDTLAHFIETRFVKWENRLNKEQKVKMFYAKSNLSDSLTIFDNSESKQLALGWK